MSKVKTSRVSRTSAGSSSSKSADLAALEAHFLASFEGVDFEHQRREEIKSGKKKAEEPLTETDTATKASKGKPQDAGVIQKQRRTGEGMQPLRRPPVTVVFDGGSSRRGGGDDSVADPNARKNWKDFMKTKTSNTGPDSFSSASEFIRERNAAKQQKKREAEGDDDSEDEAAQVTNDRQLSHLLNTTLFARGSSSTGSSGKLDKPDLSSHDTLSRILELSSSSHARKGQAFGRGHGDKSLKASQLKSMPAKIREGIRSAAGDRAAKEVERNKEMGLLTDAYSRKMMGRQYEDEIMTGKKRAKKDRVRGLSMGVGKFKGGVLKLSREEVGKMTGEGRESSRGGKGGNRGGGASKKRKIN